MCERFGLAPGTRDEASQSKTQYVMKRLLSLPRAQVIEIAREVAIDYPTEELDTAISRASTEQPADGSISMSLAAFDERGVHGFWKRALGSELN